MSKAVLIVDVPESIINVDVSVCITTLDCGMSFNTKLKPMPSKMKVDYDFIATCEVTEKVVAMGWNACISAILGEEKNES